MDCKRLLNYENNCKEEMAIKGGMLITSMVGISMRSTMDIDTTVKGQDLSLENAQRIVSEIAEIQLDDGISFTIKDVKTEGRFFCLDWVSPGTVLVDNFLTPAILDSLLV